MATTVTTGVTPVLKFQVRVRLPLVAGRSILLTESQIAPPAGLTDTGFTSANSVLVRPAGSGISLHIGYWRVPAYRRTRLLRGCVLKLVKLPPKIALSSLC